MDLKFLNKKVSLSVFLGSLFGVAALVYSLGYKMAMDRFNDVVSYVQEKQKMYSGLSELDHNIRSEYISDIPESDVLTSLCKGYISGLNDNSCGFWGKDEYNEYQENEKKLKPAVEYKKLDETMAYIKCESLINNASGNIIDKMNSMIVSGFSDLILDLRNCQKGDIEEIFKILKHVIPSGDIVNVVDSKSRTETACASTSTGVNLNFAVLVNEKTSGGAEVLASALKDSKNAKVVGVKTAGNPVRVKKVTLSDDSVLVFSDAYYVTKSGNNILKKGLTPDVVVNLSDGEDNQLQKAIDLLNESKD